MPSLVMDNSGDDSQRSLRNIDHIYLKNPVSAFKEMNWHIITFYSPQVDFQYYEKTYKFEEIWSACYQPSEMALQIILLPD